MAMTMDARFTLLKYRNTQSHIHTKKGKVPILYDDRYGNDYNYYFVIYTLVCYNYDYDYDFVVHTLVRYDYDYNYDFVVHTLVRYDYDYD